MKLFLRSFYSSRVVVRVVVSYKRKYVRKVLLNRLVKLAGKKCGELAISTWP